MEKRIIIIWFLSLLIAMGGCTKQHKAAAVKPKALLVKVVALKPAALVNTVKLVGTVEAKAVAHITAPVDGYIEKLNVRENENIFKDRELAIIATHERTSLISQTRNKLEAIQSQLLNTSANSPDYAPLTVQGEQAKKELHYAENLFLGVPVIAPLSGTVTQKFIETGAAVSAKQNLFTIVDFNTLIIKTSISEDLFSKIKPGVKLKTKFTAMPDKIYFAIVTVAYRQIDPATRNFPVELKLMNSTKQLAPGMMAELELITNKKEKTIAVPNDVLMVNPNGEKIVYVVRDSTAHQKIVTTGLSNEQLTEIVSGLTEGEKLVVMGQELLRDGITVLIQKSEKAKTESNNQL